MDLSRKTHIIWDCNGTLLNDRWLCVDVINAMLGERNQTLITDEVYLKLFDFPVKDYYERIGFDFNLEPFEIVGKEFIDVYDKRQSECVLHDGAYQMVESFTKLGYRQSVLSARQHSSLIQELKTFNLYKNFDQISGLDSFHADGKEELGKELIRTLGRDKAEIVMIGDTVHDCDVASLMGVDIILMAHGHHHIDRLGTCSVPVVTSFDDLNLLFAK